MINEKLITATAISTKLTSRQTEKFLKILENKNGKKNNYMDTSSNKIRRQYMRLLGHG